MIVDAGAGSRTAPGAAEREQRLLRPDARIGIVPAAPTAPRSTVARGHGVEVFRAKRAVPYAFDRRPTGDHLEPVNREPVTRAHRVEHRTGRRHDLRSARRRRSTQSIGAHETGSSVVRAPT